MKKYITIYFNGNTQKSFSINNLLLMDDFTKWMESNDNKPFKIHDSFNENDMLIFKQNICYIEIED